MQINVGDHVIVKSGFLKGLKLRITEIDTGVDGEPPAFDGIITEDHPTKPAWVKGKEVTFYRYELEPWPL